MVPDHIFLSPYIACMAAGAHKKHSTFSHYKTNPTWQLLFLIVIGRGLYEGINHSQKSSRWSLEAYFNQFSIMFFTKHSFKVTYCMCSSYTLIHRTVFCLLTTYKNQNICLCEAILMIQLWRTINCYHNFLTPYRKQTRDELVFNIYKKKHKLNYLNLLFMKLFVHFFLLIHYLFIFSLTDKIIVKTRIVCARYYNFKNGFQHPFTYKNARLKTRSSGGSHVCRVLYREVTQSSFYLLLCSPTLVERRRCRIQATLHRHKKRCQSRSCQKLYFGSEGVL